MPDPVFGFLAFTSGSFEGAIIRDMRLANALHRRGYKVFIYWMVETNPTLVDAGIPQRVLCRFTRYQFEKPSGLLDSLGRIFTVTPADRRRRFAQQHPNYVASLMSHFVGTICDGPGGDPALGQRLARFIEQDGVTHLLPTFAMTCPIAQQAKSVCARPFDYLVTFQGEEIFANYAERAGRIADYHRVLRDAVAASPWPAVAVSNDYIARLKSEMGLDATRLTAIYPGIDTPPELTRPFDRDAGFAALKKIFPSLRPDVPIITYLGRQDAEKGIDLLLYAVKILAERGVKLQLLCCGGSSFGLHYRESCQQIAEHLRLTIFWKRRISDEVRNIAYQMSRCIVYPSIHREPFGMVAAEAMSHGTPVIVPDSGGITESIAVDGLAGGLTFKSWDSADLAEQMQRILTDDAMYERLKGNTKKVAANFTVDRMTDRVLELLEVEAPLSAGALSPSPGTPGEGRGGGPAKAGVLR